MTLFLLISDPSFFIILNLHESLYHQNHEKGVRSAIVPKTPYLVRTEKKLILQQSWLKIYKSNRICLLGCFFKFLFKLFFNGESHFPPSRTRTRDFSPGLKKQLALVKFWWHHSVNVDHVTEILTLQTRRKLNIICKMFWGFSGHLLLNLRPFSKRWIVWYLWAAPIKILKVNKNNFYVACGSNLGPYFV